MKHRIVFFLFVVAVSFGHAQTDCNYKFNIETEEETFKVTKDQLVEFMIGKEQNVFIYFSLMKEGAVSSLVMQVSLNAKKMPLAMCFNSSSRVSFKLENGSYVSLPFLGEDNCGTQTPYEDRLNNSTSEAAFYLDTAHIAQLSEAPLESMRIATMRTNFDIDFQKLISNPQLELPIYPREFFINTLSCID